MSPKVARSWTVEIAGIVVAVVDGASGVAAEVVIVAIAETVETVAIASRVAR